MKDKDVEKCFDEFWKEIICDNSGNINLDQIKKELFDYKNLMDSAREIICEVTDGILSYPNYPAETVLSLFEEKFIDKEIIRNDILDIIKERIDNDILEDLKNYLLSL
jgi:hypothetical protein